MNFECNDGLQCVELASLWVGLVCWCERDSFHLPQFSNPPRPSRFIVESNWMPAPPDVRAPREQNSWQHQPHHRHSLQRGMVASWRLSEGWWKKTLKRYASPFQKIQVWPCWKEKEPDYQANHWLCGTYQPLQLCLNIKGGWFGFGVVVYIFTQEAWQEHLDGKKMVTKQKRLPVHSDTYTYIDKYDSMYDIIIFYRNLANLIYSSKQRSKETYSDDQSSPAG